MAKKPEVTHRSRRHLLKAAGIVGAAAGVAAPVSSASADCVLIIICGGGGSGGSGGSGSTPCFLRGMRIRTDKGYRRIETLNAGDMLPTHFGGLSPIRRVDHFTVHREASGNWPKDQRMVCVRRGAFADNVPSSDLFLTGAHAVFLDGVLVPVSSLVNDVTIFFDDAPGRASLDFFHIELEVHDVIEAEGAACESLLAKGMEACAPILQFVGGRSQFYSRLRSAAAPLVDRRTPLDMLRDRIEERSLSI